MTHRGCVRECACVRVDTRKVEWNDGVRRKSHFASGNLYTVWGNFSGIILWEHKAISRVGYEAN